MSNVIEEWEKACIHYWQISELSYIYTLIDLNLDIYLNGNIQNENIITQITEYIQYEFLKIIINKFIYNYKL